MTGESEPFRDLSGLSKILKVCLVLSVGLSVVGLWSGTMELELLDRVAAGEEVAYAEAESNDSRKALIGKCRIVVFVVTAIFFARWVYLSKRNAQALGAQGLRFTPGGSVGWFFVPAFSLWKPYQAVNETFKASNPDLEDDWASAPASGILGLWWALWLALCFLGRIAQSTETLDELVWGSRLLTLYYGVDVALGIVVIVLVSRLCRMQSAKHERVGLTEVAETGALDEGGSEDDSLCWDWHKDID